MNENLLHFGDKQLKKGRKSKVSHPQLNLEISLPVFTQTRNVTETISKRSKMLHGAKHFAISPNDV